MEVKIGVQHAPREITLDADATQDEVEQAVADAIASGGVLTLVDQRHRTIIVPADRIAYVEIGGGVTGAVGFR